MAVRFKLPKSFEDFKLSLTKDDVFNNLKPRKVPTD